MLIDSPDTFSDSFNFTMTNSINGFFIVFSDTSQNDMFFTSMTLTNEFGLLINGKDFNIDPLIHSPNGGFVIQSPDGGFSPANYRLEVSGTTQSLADNYTLAGIGATITSPVPEPSTIALMLGGLGLVGFMAVRRRKTA